MRSQRLFICSNFHQLELTTLRGPVIQSPPYPLTDIRPFVLRWKNCDTAFKKTNQNNKIPQVSTWFNNHKYRRQTHIKLKWEVSEIFQTYSHALQEFCLLNFFVKIVFIFILCVSVLHVYLNARKGYQILLQVIMSHHAVAGIELRTSGRADSTLNPSHLSAAQVFRHNH